MFGKKPSASTDPLPDAISLLMADHRTVEALHKEYEGTDDKREKRSLAHKICAALDVHAQIEEKIFYPAAKEQVEDIEDNINEGYVEHAAIKKLVREIPRLSATDEYFEPKVKVLMEFVKHHVKEEETETFPKIKQAGAMDLQEVGQQMMERKQKLESKSTAADKPASARKRQHATSPQRTMH